MEDGRRLSSLTCGKLFLAASMMCSCFAGEAYAYQQNNGSEDPSSFVYAAVALASLSFLCLVLDNYFTNAWLVENSRYSLSFRSAFSLFPVVTGAFSESISNDIQFVSSRYKQSGAYYTRLTAIVATGTSQVLLPFFIGIFAKQWVLSENSFPQYSKRLFVFSLSGTIVLGAIHLIAHVIFFHLSHVMTGGDSFDAVIDSRGIIWGLEEGSPLWGKMKHLCTRVVSFISCFENGFRRVSANENLSSIEIA